MKKYVGLTKEEVDTIEEEICLEFINKVNIEYRNLKDIFTDYYAFERTRLPEKLLNKLAGKRK